MHSDAAEPQEMKLWEGNPPGMIDGAGPGIVDPDGIRIRNVGIPGIIVHLPANAGQNRTAIVVCPGGGYKHLANFESGNGAVDFLVPKDVVVIVLKYRLAPPSMQVKADALADVKRTMRLVRFHAKEWGIDPQKIGVLGWSAGSNLALNLATHFDKGDPGASDPVERESCRPGFVGLMCPWPGGEKIDAYPIAADAPPAFIASARDDKTAPTTFAEAIAASYKTAGVPATFWQIDAGGHTAFSYKAQGEGAKWPEHFWNWLTGLH